MAPDIPRPPDCASPLPSTGACPSILSVNAQNAEDEHPSRTKKIQSFSSFDIKINKRRQRHLMSDHSSGDGYRSSSHLLSLADERAVDGLVHEIDGMIRRRFGRQQPSAGVGCG